jgi:hypothetical protein
MKSYGFNWPLYTALHKSKEEWSERERDAVARAGPVITPNSFWVPVEQSPTEEQSIEPTSRPHH